MPLLDVYFRSIFHCSFLLITALLVRHNCLFADDEPPADNGDDQIIAELQIAFPKQIQPFLQKHCVRCHRAEEMMSGIRVDQLDGTFIEHDLRLWSSIQRHVADASMPPEEESQPTESDRLVFTTWIEQGLKLARSRKKDKNGSVRRLTVAQYRNTLKDLLGLEDELTEILPPDAVSKEGFLNNEQSMLLSPILLEAYFEIAEKGLDLCIVDEDSKPIIQTFRMDLGQSINPTPFPENLILGANSHLLNNADFVVTQPRPEKLFDFNPFSMQTHFRFIEGYQGNATVRGWRDYDSIYHAVFACMRGSEGYPKGLAFQTIPEGLLIRPAIPSAEIFQVESTYGPKANFKISLRELPDQGRFRITVNAARYEDGLLLEKGVKAQPESNENTVTFSKDSPTETAQLKHAGLYQIDVYANLEDEKSSHNLHLQLGERHFSGTLHQPAFLVVRLPKGALPISTKYGEKNVSDRIVLTPLDPHSELATQFKTFEQRSPRLGVHIGLRRDCGSTLTQVGNAQPVQTSELQAYRFEGAIGNYPSPDVEKENVNYLAGVREIGFRSEFTDGRDMPRLLIRSVEFEGPLYKIWPPETHRQIFIVSENQNHPDTYAREILESFATRAFRRSVSEDETEQLLNVWKDSFSENQDFQQSIKDALLVILTAPQFLFFIENSSTPEAEQIDSWELASKLSYFLWNTAPDAELLEHAAAETLLPSLDSEIDRMIEDPRFQEFANEFTSQWLSLDKIDVVEVDRKRYPKLTRDTKTALRQEPVQYLQYLIQNNLPVRNLVQSDFIVANEVTANYYGLGSQTESGLEFVPVRHQSEHLGGLLSQAGILAGLSDGRESNPVKRGAWLARKIIAEPPDDPPPNVPALDEDLTKLTLREKLELHRNQKGCVKCHLGIDPWGVPFEQYDAAGLFKTGAKVDSHSTLPDTTKVADLKELKEYLANDRIDQVAFSFLKHLASYAAGRSLTYSEIEFLKEKGLEFQLEEYRMQDLIHFVIKSELFLEK